MGRNPKGGVRFWSSVHAAARSLDADRNNVLKAVQGRTRIKGWLLMDEKDWVAGRSWPVIRRRRPSIPVHGVCGGETRMWPSMNRCAHDLGVTVDQVRRHMRSGRPLCDWLLSHAETE